MMAVQTPPLGQTNPQSVAGAPPWLVDFLIHPPLWFKAGLLLATATVLAIAARSVLRRDFYISLQELREMALIVGTVEAVAVGVVGSMQFLRLGFGPAAAVGLVSGFVAVEVVRRLGWRLPSTWADERDLVLVAWGTIAFGAFMLPEVIYVGNRPYYLALKVGVTSIAIVGVGWTMLQEYGPGDTLRESIKEAQSP